MIELYILLVVMFGAGIVSVAIKDLLASAIAMGVVGFSLAIIFILVGAPDLAIVQIVVEILTVVIFTAVLLRSTHIDETLESPPAVFPTVTFILFAILFMVFFVSALREFPVFGNPVMKVGNEYIKRAIAEVRAANVVAAVILDYRGYDTLGEATVLFTSVIGVLTILRRIGKR